MRRIGQNADVKDVVRQSRQDALAELYATGVPVPSSADDAIIAKLTSSSAWGGELRSCGDSDPDLRDD